MMTNVVFPGWRKKAFTMSYDDGEEQDIRLIALMKQYGVKGTFNLNGAWLEQDEYSYSPGTLNRRMGCKLAYQTYADSGMEVALHSYTHPFLNRVPKEVALYEIMKDREILESIFGYPIQGMAYPMGAYSDEVVQLLNTCKIAYARTVTSTHNFNLPTDWLRLPATCHHGDPKALELAHRFAEEQAPWNGPWLFYLWGHSHEFEAYDQWDRIEEILSVVGGHDDVWYATNMEIYRYIKAYNALEFGVECKSVYNPSCTDVYFMRDGKQLLARAGELTCFPEVTINRNNFL